MRKFLFAGIVVMLALAAFITTAMLPGSEIDVAEADSPFEASIIKGFGCGVFDGDGNGVFTPDGRISVVTSSAHTTLICKADGVANSTGQAVIFKNFGCGTALGFTTDSMNIVSSEGDVTLRCRI